jgi:hypothetical protein
LSKTNRYCSTEKYIIAGIAMTRTLSTGSDLKKGGGIGGLANYDVDNREHLRVLTNVALSGIIISRT